VCGHERPEWGTVRRGERESSASSRSRIYLDYNAMTPLLSEVVDAQR
jgi:hypothetical protein